MNSTEPQQIAEIQKDSKDFETLLDVFRTLLEWQEDLERNKEEKDGCGNHQSDFVGSTK